MKAASLASLLVLFATLPSPAAGIHELPPTCTPAVYARIIPALESVEIPDHEFIDASPREVVEYLFQIKRKARLSTGTSMFAKWPPSPASISLTTKNDSFLTALDKLCAAAGLTWQMTSGGLAIQPLKPIPTE